MSIIPDRLLVNVQADFSRLNADGNSVLNKEFDKISDADGAKFFIALNQDIDIETFYNYNADKYGGDLTDEYLAKRDEVTRSYNEIKNKEKQSLELQFAPEKRIDPSNTEAVNKFYRNPEEGMVYTYKGYDIKYTGGKYHCSGKDYEPSKQIQGITYYLNQDIIKDFYSKYNNELENTKSETEIDSVISKFVEELFKIDGRLDYDYLAANEVKGSKFSCRRRLGDFVVKINYELGDNKVILNSFEKEKHSE